MDVGVSERTQRTLDALARQAPALLDEVRAGRMSAHGAAKAAGIVRQRSIVEQMVALWRKADEAERAEFLAEIGR